MAAGESHGGLYNDNAFQDSCGRPELSAKTRECTLAVAP